MKKSIFLKNLWSFGGHLGLYFLNFYGKVREIVLVTDSHQKPENCCGGIKCVNLGKCVGDFLHLNPERSY